MTPPLRRQYLAIKRRYPDMLVLFQVGDFFETFDDDAITLSRALGVTLTTKHLGKNLRVPLAGIPVHSLHHHLGKLVNKGYKVAICEQLTPPGKTLIKREVTRIVTPGTVVEPALLEGKTNNYLASFVIEGGRAGIAYVDVTTSEFAATELAVEPALEELARLQPSELLLPQSLIQNDQSIAGIAALASGELAPVTLLEDQQISLETTRRVLLDHFEAHSLSAYGCEQLPLAVRAAGAIIQYLRRTQPAAVEQLTRLSTYAVSAFMTLDAHTVRNLEIFESTAGTAFGSLLAVIDLTTTPMGGRRLKQWLRQPLLNLNELTQRQDAVEWFYRNETARRQLRASLEQISDLERLIGRVKSGIATPRELVVLGRSLELVPKIQACFAGSPAPLQPLLARLKPCSEAAQLITNAIVDDPPATIDQGGVIKEGYAKELDRLRSVLKDSKGYLADLETRERARTRIRSLKVNYNKVFGYYLEVTKPNLHLVPADYIRKQTIVNGERFFTLELKEHESVVTHAQDHALELEASLFSQVCRRLGERREEVISTARALAELDVYSALAEAAVRYKYVRPRLTEESTLLIKAGRHPVVERCLSEGQSFVPNDAHLSNDEIQIMILTGPNLSGKSTYLRQVALIVLLAQIGCFVPAEAAIIGITDRIFSRVGLEDNISRGQSSFMIEMAETASILHHATPGSLIILDEIGRGTSTYDGLSIARAVVEYLHNHSRLCAKTLFATHYHELTDLEDILPRVKNFHTTVAEEGGAIRFLRQVVPGKATRSYGVQVAKLAGLPRPVIHRAKEILAQYETSAPRYAGMINYEPPAASYKMVAEPRAEYKVASRPERPLIDLPQAIINELLHLDIDAMTPVEALTKLYELKKRAEGR
ncbi:DNA mismatch repair protein MutS [candidate division KSB1 bacterium]|nr:DNA mismatch repair protein MutS [candidate division KSB1 bacterium]